MRRTPLFEFIDTFSLDSVVYRVVLKMWTYPTPADNSQLWETLKVSELLLNSWIVRGPHLLLNCTGKRGLCDAEIQRAGSIAVESCSCNCTECVGFFY